MGDEINPTTCVFLTSEFSAKKLLPRINDVSDFGTSWLIRPWPIYLVYRLCWAVFWITVVLLAVFLPTNEEDGISGRFFLFLTNWGMILLASGSTLRLLVAVHYFRSPSEQGSENEGRSKWLYVYKLDFILYTVYTNAALYITTIYWLLLHEGETSFVGICSHAVNAVYVLTDFFVCSFPFHLLSVWYSLIFGNIYLTTNVVYWALTGNLIYSITDWGNDPGTASVVAVGSNILLVVFQLLLFLFFWLRSLIRYKCIRCE